MKSAFASIVSLVFVFFLGVSNDALGDERAVQVSSERALSHEATVKMVDARGKKISVVTFDDAVIEGKARGPDGFVLRSRDVAGARSVLELRKDFRSEVISDAFGAVPVVPGLP